jgi:hypothetical protein
MRKRIATGLFAACLSVALCAPSTALAEFGIASFDTATETDKGGAYTQAGGHPYAITTQIEWNHHDDPGNPGLPLPDGELKDGIVDLPPGVLGNPTVTPRCTMEDLVFADDPANQYPLFRRNNCPIDSQIGIIKAAFNFTEAVGAGGTYPLFNMATPTGVPARFGFKILGVPLSLDASLRSDGEYAITVGSRNTPEALRVVASDVVIWGTPADPSHDFQRCNVSGMGFDREKGCSSYPAEHGGFENPSGAPLIPFMTHPTACTPEGVGQKWTLHTDSWEDQGNYKTASVFTHLPPFAPEPPGPRQGPTGCDLVPFNPKFSAVPTQHSGASASGLDVEVSLPTSGILNPDGIAQSHVKKAVVTLPEGMTVNPSVSEGLSVCTPAQYASETVNSLEGGGCPSSSKLGTVAIETPVLEETAEGALYIAQQDDPATGAKGAENPFDSLLALYLVAKVPERGVLVKLAGRVEPDPNTGQLITTFDDLPQLPFSKFKLKFREGQRSPLITPTRCGTYTTEADFYPWARPNTPVRTLSSFEVTSGPSGGACPSGGVPSFNPGFSAGSVSNNAGSYSPFLMRLTRNDGEQDLTKFSALLPPGVSAKIAGVSKCSSAAIALASEKSGREERESPSCPANSRIGSILAGAGVGSTLVYVPGDLYLSGPYNGAPLSVVAITPAVAGPFDIGTVIVRVALSLDPRTAEVKVDGDRSDPIPHILEGIPLAVRDIRVNVDRQNFTINPTSCDPMAVGATLFGSFQDLLSPHDDRPVSLSDRYQAANCATLGFKPRLRMKLKGGTKRGRFPAFQAIYRPRPGDANLRKAVVTLPKSAFLEQGHIRTICTRVQYAAKACPAGSIYGRVKATSPLIDTPLEGPVYLRSSNHNLPDLVFALKGIVDIEAVGRVDSVRLGRSADFGIRASFEGVPDAPLTEVVLNMQGGRKGLIVNSRNLCKGKAPKANVELDAQSAKTYDFKPKLASTCSQRQRNAKRRQLHKQR